MSKGSLVVNSSQGGGSKDTWVLAPDRLRAVRSRCRRSRRAIMIADTRPLLSRVADSVYWMARYIERAENVARFIDVESQPACSTCRVDGQSVAAHHRYHRRPRESFAKRYGEATPAERGSVSGVRCRQYRIRSISCLRGGPRECALACARPSPRKCGSRSTACTC